MKFLENDFKRIFSLVNENKSDLAIDELNTFYSSNKKDKNVLFLLSLANLKLKNFKQALNFIKKALTYDKLNFDYLGLQAMVYSNLKDYNNALKIYDRLILNYPNNPSAYEHKFTLLRKINRPREKINFLNHIKNLKHLNFKYIESHLIDTELEILDWSNFEEKKPKLILLLLYFWVKLLFAFFFYKKF